MAKKADAKSKNKAKDAEVVETPAADPYAPEEIAKTEAAAAGADGGDITTSQTVTYSMSGGLVQWLARNNTAPCPVILSVGQILPDRAQPQGRSAGR